MLHFLDQFKMSGFARLWEAKASWNCRHFIWHVGERLWNDR